MTSKSRASHPIIVGYIFWVLGFFGTHRFYYGKPLTGAFWALTFGLLLIGWIVDLFLIPRMNREAQRTYPDGFYNYALGWLFLIFLGVFGAHRMYLDKWITGILYFFTGGLFLVGWIYDLFTFNTQIREKNLSVDHS